uniref:Zig-10 n=1 Tax=Pristionchus pacificus TaxID=54126 RepID=A0A2A6CXI9_PRIPA|eukprot:PDM82885.1 zig-10 [Pristionchus pacificus]
MHFQAYSQMPTQLCHRLLLLLLLVTGVSLAEDAKKDGKKLEQFVPEGSTTALMCEPIFSGESSFATWYKNGVPIANVTSKSNALLPARTYKPKQSVPEVGFLIVSDIRREDAGTYECRDAVTNASGVASTLRVAYVDALALEHHITLAPRRISLGEPLRLRCPPPAADPPPAVSWQLNGSPLSRYAPDAAAFPNGTLHIPRFTLSHLVGDTGRVAQADGRGFSKLEMEESGGLYTCNFTNFAGRATSRVFIDAKDLAIDRALPDSVDSVSQRCTYFFRACVLWFLIGCLATRKPVMPLPDYYIPAPTQPPAS